jgi:hypothetical protein
VRLRLCCKRVNNSNELVNEQDRHQVDGSPSGPCCYYLPTGDHSTFGRTKNILAAFNNHGVEREFTVCHGKISIGQDKK